MKLKKSMYNVEIDRIDNENVLMFNSFTTAFGIMDKRACEIYFHSDLIDEECVKNKEDQETISIMKDNGFLVNRELDEYAKLKVIGNMSRYSNENFSLMIAPTMACNMACPYCYEEKTNKRMSENIENALVDYVEKTIINNKIKKFNVAWYGGEPLLEKKMILRLSRKFINICKDNNVIYTAMIVTNGSLLDKSTANMLKEECQVSFAQITIDGLSENNNSRRKLKSGENSFEIITNNIDVSNEFIDIKIRINIDKTNLEETKQLINYFMDDKKWDKNRVKYYFAPVTNVTDACTAKVEDCFTSTEFGKIDAKLLDFIYKKGNVETIKEMYPKFATCSCDAVTPNTYVVDPEGFLYKCADVIGIKSNRVGDIFSGPEFNNEYIELLNLDTPDECKECNLLPYVKEDVRD